MDRQTGLAASLDELLDLDARALDDLYRRAAVPALDALAGDLRGRMLAWPAAPAALAPALRALGRWDRFPWRGKSFVTGAGVNRVLIDRLKLFRFSTSVAPSRSGAGEAVQLDYDRPGNPFFIRAIVDELRELAPGLYLGQAYLKLGARPRLLLYFGLQAR